MGKTEKTKPYGLTKPCDDCPFRTDVRPYLRAERVFEIQQSLVHAEFPCHKTTWAKGAERAGDGTYIRSGKEMHCAGALILLEKLEQPSQMMRICERLGMYDRRKLDMTAPVYDTFEDMAQAQEVELRRPVSPKKTKKRARP